MGPPGGDPESHQPYSTEHLKDLLRAPGQNQEVQEGQCQGELNVSRAQLVAQDLHLLLQ